MKEIRDLLMDIRIELRSHLRDFHKTDLCRRIDDARDQLLHAPASDAPPPMLSVEAADRVAQAWQAAAEDLKNTTPAFYELLAKKVALRLAALPTLPQSPPPESTSIAEADHGELATTASVVDAEVEAQAVDAVEVALAAVEISSTLGTVDGHIPSIEVLQAIAASKRRFTEVQREWCVGEAMVRSGFSIDPESFIALVDSEMARYLLEEPVEE